MKLATAQQMQTMDRIAIGERHIPSLDLMERAAEGVAAAAEELAEEKSGFCPTGEGMVVLSEERATFSVSPARHPKRAGVFVGPGNNGGDGVAAARLLAQRGWEVRVFLAGDREKLTPDNAANVARLGEVGLALECFPAELSADVAESCTFLAWCAGCDVFVDALFGVGLAREVGGIFAAAISLMNGLSVPVVAVDIASGLDADTGRVLGTAVCAAVTVTFSVAKVGQFADQGALHTGKLIVHDIGIPPEIGAGFTWDTEAIDLELARQWLPRRKADGHKGDFGRDYILAGSVGFTGAPVLAARSCVRSGAGLVTVGTPQSAYPIVAGKCLEEMPYPLPEHDGKLSTAAREDILEKVRGCDAVLIGPGLGRGAESDALICDLTAELPQSLVLDADGINAVSEHIDILHRRAGRVTVLTPHDGEFDRLGGDLTGQDRLSAARAFAREHGCVLVLKGHRTIVAAPDGRTGINTTGNSGMAKGGSGDVLSGMILSLLGQGMEPFRAACTAVWLHGRAGDLAAAELGEYSMTPSDLIAHLSGAICGVTAPAAADCK